MSNGSGFCLADRLISNDSAPLVIAEIGINHEGDIDKAVQMVDRAAEVGCECVKFQSHIIEDEMIPNNVIPGNADELSILIDAGVKSFKAFMIDSGVDEFPASDLATLDQAMPILAAGDATLLVHAELPTATSNASTPQADEFGSYEAFLSSRPDAWEMDAIKAIINLSKKHHCKGFIEIILFAS